MGARKTLYDGVRAAVEAISGLTEHKGAVTAEGLPSPGAKRAGASMFVVRMPTTAAIGDRQRSRWRDSEVVTVGLLIDMPQMDRPAGFGRSLDLEDDIISAVLTSTTAAGWTTLFAGSTRDDAGDGAYLTCLLTFEAVATLNLAGS